MKNMKKQNGITLIALVVSIVVMLILVGVTISITIQEGGLFSQAKEASSQTENKIDYETNVLPQEMEDYVNDALKDLLK